MPTNNHPATDGSTRFRNYRLLLGLASLCLLLDQVTKAIIRQTIPYGTYFLGGATVEPTPVIPGTFYLVHIGNHGAAWGILGGKSLFLAALAIIVLLWIFLQRRAIGLHRLPLQFYFGFLIGGILGNFVDRVRLGFVTDFLDVHIPAIGFLGFPGYRWPAFNLADSFIFTGVTLYLIHTFFFEKKPPEVPPSSAEVN